MISRSENGRKSSSGLVTRAARQPDQSPGLEARPRDSPSRSVRPTTLHLPERTGEGPHHPRTHLDTCAAFFSKRRIMISCSQSSQSYPPMRQIGQGWSSDSVLASEMEREGCWKFWKRFYSLGRGETVKMREHFVAAASFLPSQDGCMRTWCSVSQQPLCDPAAVLLTC